MNIYTCNTRPNSMSKHYLPNLVTPSIGPTMVGIDQYSKSCCFAIRWWLRICFWFLSSLLASRMIWWTIKMCLHHRRYPHHRRYQHHRYWEHHYRNSGHSLRHFSVVLPSSTHLYDVFFWCTAFFDKLPLFEQQHCRTNPWEIKYIFTMMIKQLQLTILTIPPIVLSSVLSDWNSSIAALQTSIIDSVFAWTVYSDLMNSNTWWKMRQSLILFFDEQIIFPVSFQNEILQSLHWKT